MQVATTIRTPRADPRLRTQTPPGRYLGVRDLLLFLSALPVALAAQQVKTRPLPEVARRVTAIGALITTEEPDQAARAAVRALNRLKRWYGALDTCLTRSLVAGALLAREDVVLNIGFRPDPDPESDSTDGHAWLTLADQPLELTGIEIAPDQLFTTTLKLPLSRGRGRKNPSATE